jgi:hypothetical protein
MHREERKERRQEQKFEHEELQLEKAEDKALWVIAHELKEIAFWLKKLVSSEEVPAPTAIQIYQTGETIMAAILPSATGTFGLINTPAGTVIPASAIITWTADNSVDVSAPSPSLASGSSPAGLTVALTSAASPVATSFNLSVTVAFTDPVSGVAQNLAATLNVTLGSGGGGTPVAGPTSVAITQLS